MAFRIGSEEIKKIYFQDTKAEKVFLGVEAVYEPNGDVPPNDEIWYTTNTGAVSNITGGFGTANIVSNEIQKDGKCVLKFDTEVTSTDKQKGFFNKTDVTWVAFPESLVNFGDFALGGCKNLTGATFSTQKTRILYRFFDNCKALTEYQIPEQVTMIESGAFQGTSLTAIELSDKITSIGTYAFDNCPISTIYFSKSIKDIKAYAFKWSNLDSINGDSANPYLSFENNCIVNKSNKTLVGGSNGMTELPSGITSIGEGACTSLKFDKLVFPDTLTTIGRSACQYISANEIVFNEGLKTIEYNAFYQGTKPVFPKEITIPSTVTTIGGSAFAAFNNALYTVHMKGETPANIQTSSFKKFDGFKIYVPKGTVDTYKTTGNWVSFADYIYEEESWIAITSDMDRSIPFRKIKFNLNGLDGTDCRDNYISEKPNINTDGKSWSSVRTEAYGYAGQYRLSLYSGGYIDFARYDGGPKPDSKITTYGTQIADGVYVYEYPHNMYWSGVGSVDGDVETKYSKLSKCVAIEPYEEEISAEIEGADSISPSTPETYTFKGGDNNNVWKVTSSDGNPDAWLEINSQDAHSCQIGSVIDSIGGEGAVWDILVLDGNGDTIAKKSVTITEVEEW